MHPHFGHFAPSGTKSFASFAHHAFVPSVLTTSWIFFIDSSVTLDLEYGTDYSFSGTTAVWTLPVIDADVSGMQNAITIKNRGTGQLTINTTLLENVLFDTSLTNNIILNIGDAIMLMPDGIYFNVE